jgi:decaprenyl-phosphate phosphoribosyltransferase
MSEIIVDTSPFPQLRGALVLMRPKQWIKNGFVFAPLLFSGKFLDPLAVANAMTATLLFCLGSSATYIINDIRDIEKDRKHPVKSKTRPLAAGTVSLSVSLALLGAIYGALIGAWFIEPDVMLVIVAYMAMNLAYTYALKHQPVLDIFTIATGFVLRVFAGATALAVPVSSWMFITTLCLALYLAAVKRRQELSHNGTESRKVLSKYSLTLMDRYAEMSAMGALMFYSMFVMSSKPQLAVTMPLVLFGLFRYWYVVEELDGGESPTDALFADRQLLLTVLIWIGACVWALWPAA